MAQTRTYRTQDPALGRVLQTRFALFFMPACVMDGAGQVVWWNRHAELATGLAARDLLGGKEGTRLFAPDDKAGRLLDLFLEGDETGLAAAFGAEHLLRDADGNLSVWAAPPSGSFERAPRLLLCGSGRDEATGNGFTHLAWCSLAHYDFTRSPSVDLHQLLRCLDRNGDVWFGVNQHELNLYLSRPLIDELYAPDMRAEELAGTSVRMSMQPAVAQDHGRTINALDESSSRDTILHWLHDNKRGKTIWTQAWPNIIKVNGQRANFSLVRDITAEKERDFLLEGVLASQQKGRQPFAQKLLTMFAGRSAVMVRTLEILLRAALSLVTVAIYGETGTGKSLAARLVHQLSSRAEGPFTYVNCGAIPDELFESSFFGHVKGSFTGAVRDAEGLLTKADQGTLFLDEIAELSPRAQSKLLQALSEKTYTPLGSTQELRSKFRLIVATNRNVEEMVRLGTFREDLYYRVNVLDVRLPPLRERKDDIPLLLNALLRRNDIALTPPAPAVKALCAHSWPGNIRELENVILRYAAEGNLDFFRPTETPGARPDPENSGTAHGEVGLRDRVARFEREVIETTLTRHHWNRRRTAEALSITRMTLFRKMREFGLLEDKEGN